MFLRIDVVPLPVDMLVVFGIIILAFALFVSEVVPVDITALLVMILLIALGPWTHISPREGISGFANEATITVLAMFILSEGIRRSGAIQLVSRKVIRFVGSDERKLLLSIVGLSGVSSGFINNTPVVAVMIPVARDIAQRTGISVSKLLIPISYASMFGGMLTLIGTSTNLLASAVSARLIGRRFSMFEFTHLGALVFLTGAIYLLVVGRYLLPDHVDPDEELTDEFEMDEYLTEVVVRNDSPAIGGTIEKITSHYPYDFKIVQVIRGGCPIEKPHSSTTVQANDRFLIRAPRDTIFDLLDAEEFTHSSLSQTDSDIEIGVGKEAEKLSEVIIVPRSPNPSETLTTGEFQEKYNAAVLAIRRGDELIHRQLDELPLRSGDTLLVLTSERFLERLNGSRNFVVLSEFDSPIHQTSRFFIALGTVVAVVAVAAAGAYPIFVTALGGVVVMVFTGVLKPDELYNAVDWGVIFLLAGVIPLGMALERTGGAALLADVITTSAGDFPPLVVLGLFYLVTSLITELISNNASVVLMLPVAVDVARQLGANEFAFVLAVAFAASTSILTPIGYQTNLMVYGAGSYRFTDFFRVGAPLQLLLTVVTTLGIGLFWGV